MFYDKLNNLLGEELKKALILFFLVFIFSTFNKLNSQGSSSYFSKEIDMSTSIEAIYSNINVMNNSIYNLKNQMKNLNGKINNLNNANDELSRNLESKINLNTDEIKQLQNECNLIGIDYKAVTEQITIFERSLDSLLLTLKEHDIDIDNLKSDLRILREGYFELKKEFVKIPSIMFCTECYPKISISFSNNRYLTFSMDDLKAMPSYSLDATYYDTENIGFWINYISPFLVTISSKLQDSISISDHWSTNIVSGGFLYNYKPSSNNFSIRLGAGLFFGSAEFDKYMNRSRWTVDLLQ